MKFSYCFKQWFIHVCNLFTTDSCILAFDQVQRFLKKALVNLSIYFHVPHGAHPPILQVILWLWRCLTRGRVVALTLQKKWCLWYPSRCLVLPSLEEGLLPDPGACGSALVVTVCPGAGNPCLAVYCLTTFIVVKWQSEACSMSFSILGWFTSLCRRRGLRKGCCLVFQSIHQVTIAL